jgi:hypothetical protein
MAGIYHFETHHTPDLFELQDTFMMDFICIIENEWKFRHLHQETYLQSLYDYVKSDLPRWDSLFDDEEWEEEEETEDLVHLE